MIHTLWKAGTTTIQRAFPRRSSASGTRFISPSDRPPGEFPRHTAVLLARDPLERFASGVGEVFLRGAHHRHHGSVAGHTPLWWQHLRHYQTTGDMITLVSNMLRDVESFELYPPCMDSQHSMPLRHLLTAGAFYSRARYPEGWLRHIREIDYDQLWVVGPVTGRVNASGEALTLDQALRRHAPAYPVEPGRDSRDRPGDVPTTAEVKAVLLEANNTALLERFCRVYAADYLCFGWEPPGACSKFFAL